MRKQFPWFELILCVVFLSAYAYAAFSDAYNLPNRWFIRDDAYYYFKVAQNISEGHGSTFDGIHPTNGYHPLWMLVCIPIFALARFDLILPLRILVLVTGVLQISTAILLYRLLRTLVLPPLAMLAAIFWAFDSYILVFLYKTGVESSAALFFITLLLYMTMRFERTWRLSAPRTRQIAILAAVAAVSVFSRLDLVFFAMVMGIWIVLRQSAVRYLLPLDALVIFVSALAACLARLGFAVYYEIVNAAIAMVVVGLAIKVPTLYLLGLYQRPTSWKPLRFLARLIVAVLVGSGLTSALLLAAAALHLLPPISRTVLGIDAALTFGLLLLIRSGAYVFRRSEAPAEPRSPLAELQWDWRQWLKDGSIYYGIVGGSLALYMAWNRLAFGSFSPVSGQIKRWWGTFLISVYGSPAKTWLSFFGVDPYGEYNAWQPATNLLRDWSNKLLYHNASQFGNPAWQQTYIRVLVIALALVVLILLLARRKSVRAIVQLSMIPLFVGGWLQALSYNATGYASPKEWYWLTQPILLVILATVLVDVLLSLLPKRWPVATTLAWGMTAAYGVALAGGFWRDNVALNPYGQAPANVPYAEVIPFLRAHTEPGAIIGMTGGGNVGYFLPDRTIVNMDGLINSSEYFQDLKAGTGSDYLYDSGMRYVFANPDLLKANPYRGQFSARLEGIASWGGKDLMKLLPSRSE
ncbi:MAG TPA: hypothetical protein VMJ64_09505 [Anaerolineales bacterium]|nr:hypothetical protein [Anaerolineales bacterium]